MEFEALIASTLEGMGYELIEIEQSGHNKLLRIFVDKNEGINIDDCVTISNHLTRLLTVENIDYGRLEVSSPGLDRPLKKEADFARFEQETIKLKLRIPVEGQRNFIGILREARNGVIKLEVEGKLLDFELSNLMKARLVPKL
ncbi:MAG: ribosome maturation factor RimP [Nitrosomonas sp.]|nr:ribosome maturation factor RimP [Nitrosomonas sp.]